MPLKIILISLLFLSVSDPKSESSIVWNEDLQLSWSDFRGVIQPDSGAAAVTSSGITFAVSIQTTNSKITSFRTKAEAHFYPEHSWYDVERANNYILRHEQLHFDITELHVRKLRAAIAQVKVSPDVKQILNDLHKQAKNDLMQMQLQYDSESRNSRNMEKQLEWESFVASELLTWEDYKQTK